MPTPKLSYDEVSKLIDQELMGDQAQAIPTDPVDLKLLTNLYESQDKRDQKVQQHAMQREQFIASNAADGVPFDVDTGLPGAMRAKLSFESDLAKRGEWLAKQPGIEAVRPTADGRSLIARVTDKEGNPRDILMDEQGLTSRDLAELTGALPEIAAGAIAAYLTGGSSLIGQAAAGAGGATLARLNKDVAVRSLAGTDQKSTGETYSDQVAPAVLDFALPLVPAAVKRSAQALVGPFARTAGALEREAMQSASRLGVDLTAAQRTGNPALARAEAFSSNIPGGGPLKAQAAAQEEAIRNVQRDLLGVPPGEVASAQSIADRAGRVLSRAEERQMTKVQDLRMRAASLAQRNIAGLLDSGTVPSNLSTSEIGSVLRSRVVAKRDAFKAQARELYEAVRAAGGGEVQVPTDPVRNLIKKIERDSPDAAKVLAPELRRIFNVGSTLVEKRVNKPIFNAKGELAIPLIEVVPKDLPLGQAIELRALISDSVKRGEALGDIPSRYLKQLAGALTESIEGGVKAAPNPEVAKALRQANDYYRTNVPRFEQRGIADLFADPTQGGFVDDSRLVKRLFDGGGDIDMLRRTRDLLGADSADYKLLRRAGLQRLVDDSVPLGSEVIDAGSFLNRLQSLDREVRRELLGDLEKPLLDASRVIGNTRIEKISSRDLEKVLESAPKDAGNLLRQAVKKQNVLERHYRSKFNRAITDGVVDPKLFNADEFVTNFVNNGSAREIRQAMAFLRVKGGKDLVEDIRRRTMLDVLNRVSRTTKPEDVVGADKFVDLAYDKLSDVLKRDGEKLQTIIGKDSLDVLRDLATVEAARAKGRSAGGAAGNLVQANIIANLMNLRVAEASRILKNRAMAWALTQPGLKQWLGSGLQVPSTPNARLAVFASAPMLRAIGEEFRDEPNLAGSLLDAVYSGRDYQQVERERRIGTDLDRAIEEYLSQPDSASN